jgi:hypothetical protein
MTVQHFPVKKPKENLNVSKLPHLQMMASVLWTWNIINC